MIDRAVGPSETWKVPDYVIAPNFRLAFREVIAFVTTFATMYPWLV
jgi:hypothetical protein